jgi:hypothetical protein
MLLQLTTALLLPWLLGIAWLRVGWHHPTAGAGPQLLGYGYFLGMLATTLIIRLWDALGLTLAFWPLTGLLLITTLGGFWLSRDIPYGRGWSTAANSTFNAQKGRQTLLFGLLLTVIVLRWAGLGLEILWRPLYPWDAWTTWAPRAHVWFALQSLVPFTDSATWLQRSGQELIYTLPAWDYPKTVSLLQLWISLALDRWDDSLINLPWLLCGGALSLAFYGQLRAWDLAPLPSLLGVYLLLSLPLLNAHIALAGYADLWLAATYSLAGMAFLRWTRTGDPWQGRLALLLIVACPLIKREGLIWILTFLPPLLVAQLSRKAALAVGSSGLAALVVGYLAGGISIGGFQITPEVIQIPFLGRFELALHFVWEPFSRNLFLMSNWHLLWYLAIAALCLAAARMGRQQEWVISTMLILSSLSVVLITFFLTSNAAWAERYTSINRILFHLVPLLLFSILLLFKPRRVQFSKGIPDSI